MRLLINIDVPDLDRAQALYGDAFGLRPGRRLGEGVLELLGAAVPIYLLQASARTSAAADRPRDYARHWTPLHLDVVVDNLAEALARAEAAGLVREGQVRQADWGCIATLHDPFGHGWCLIQFSAQGYAAIAR
ncbi:VOC family protein [Pseudoxanthomonas winnipegensis]|uniref:VOC family protein n=1 Tax=Pseudoxanthomonas winnipegensis TaxID=2480810 RepID=A0A4Q8LZV1_9GAMM|nr:VOC family protein [Pseudoxanthomonas winnipegensis]RZZ86937.1 VOC family protein [Pseudoxanthomonas winnipegensis]TAA37847.1 VOC family protein [Pseudoxanthomonas winnipegensis]